MTDRPIAITAAEAPLAIHPQGWFGILAHGSAGLNRRLPPPPPCGRSPSPKGGGIKALALNHKFHPLWGVQTGDIEDTRSGTSRTPWPT